MALLPVPPQLERFVRLADGPNGAIRFLPLEELLGVYLDRLFPGYEAHGRCTFRVLRDSDIEVEEEAEDLVREFETALKRRRQRRGHPAEAERRRARRAEAADRGARSRSGATS